MKEEREKNLEEITNLNKEIVDMAWKKDQEQRRLDDKNITKKQQQETRGLTTEFDQVSIDIQIAESRIKDLEG